MNKVLDKVLCFDRFALDLRRGSLRAGRQAIELRPKAFDVLCHLVENDRRLVPKEELLAAVWPGISVSDDSLVQCIRELRAKLGDDGHRLIKTVARRGYMLDVPVTAHPARAPARRFAPDLPHVLRAASDALRQATRRLGGPQRSMYAAVGFACAALAAGYLFARWPAGPASNELFTAADARRLAAIAREKEIPLPAFQISRIAPDVPEDMRRFVGVWVSTTGFVNSKRQFMIIVTEVDKAGLVTGFAVRGPPQPLSLVQEPAAAWQFKARISGDSFAHDSSASRQVVVLNGENRLEYTETWPAARAFVVLDPVWTLAQAERVAGSARADKS
jgi:DNA-binding winged helix-turn-helix (wHTH) protein